MASTIFTPKFFSDFEKYTLFLAKFPTTPRSISEMREQDTEGLLPKWMPARIGENVDEEGNPKKFLEYVDRRTHETKQEPLFAGDTDPLDGFWMYFESFGQEYARKYEEWLPAAKKEIAFYWNVTLTEEEFIEYYIWYFVFQMAC